MITKIEAARIAMDGGANMIIASGKEQNPIKALMDGGKNSHFIAKTTPHLARKKWISGMLTPNGKIYIDDGAKAALLKGRSLLPAGIVSAEGKFERGDAIIIFDKDQNEIARGLSAYSIDDTISIKGKNSEEIEQILGYRGRTALVHRDDLVISDTGN
jgi:glutamate 5-kinase